MGIGGEPRPPGYVGPCISLLPACPLHQLPHRPAGKKGQVLDSNKCVLSYKDGSESPGLPLVSPFVPFHKAASSSYNVHLTVLLPRTTHHPVALHCPGSSPSPLAEQQQGVPRFPNRPLPPPSLTSSYSSCQHLSPAHSLHFCHHVLLMLRLSELSLFFPQPTLCNLQEEAQALPLPGKLPGPTFLPSVSDILPCPQASGVLLCVLPRECILWTLDSYKCHLSSFLLWLLGCSGLHCRPYGMLVALQSHLPLAASHFLNPACFPPTFPHCFPFIFLDSMHALQKTTLKSFYRE